MAVFECIAFYVFYGVGYGDRGKTEATTVFANAFISNTCVLNGRKV